MTEEIVYLNAPNRRPPDVIHKALYLGRRYKVLHPQSISDEQGLCAGFEDALARGGVLTLDQNAENAFLWDPGSVSLSGDVELMCGDEAITLNANTPVASGQFVLSHARLSTPVITSHHDGHRLSFEAEFDYVYSSEDMPTRLGVATMLEASCFVVLENGERHILFQSTEDDPVLYVKGGPNKSALKIISDVSTEDTPQAKTYLENIVHRIPEQVHGQRVESMTVLEQYKSYFMQRELPVSEDQIWTPVCAPITWGWSIRLNRREDSEWTITRQKLLYPAVGHDGMEMPVWEGYATGEESPSV